GELELFHAPDGEAYATASVNGHRKTMALRSRAFGNFLTRQHYEMNGRPLRMQARAELLALLDAHATLEGPETPVWLRVGRDDDAIYIDLGTETWEAVRVGRTGWTIVPTPPVKFMRGTGMLPLPVPIEGGRLDELRPFVNVPDDDGWY